MFWHVTPRQVKATQSTVSSPICVRIPCNDTTEVKDEAVDTFPELGVGETGNVTYNTTHFVLRNGSTVVTCMEIRKLSWQQTPQFGIKC